MTVLRSHTLPIALACLLALCLPAVAPGQSPEEVQAQIRELKRDRQKAEAHAATLREAWAAFNVKRSPDAEELFGSVLAAEEATEAERVQALWGMAQTLAHHVAGEQTEPAREHLTRIVEEYPDNPVAAWALLELGRLAGTRTAEQRQAGRAYYERMLAEYPDSVAVDEATARLAETYLREKETFKLPVEGLELLEQRLAEAPDNPLNMVQLFMTANWWMKGYYNYERAQPYNRRLGEVRMNDPFRWGFQFFSVGQVYLIEQNDPVRALPWFLRIVQELPRALMRFPAKRRVRDILEQYPGIVEENPHLLEEYPVLREFLNG